MIRAFMSALILTVLAFNIGCSQFFLKDFQPSPFRASDQKLLDDALTKTLKQLELKENLEKLARLKNRKVSVHVAIASSDNSDTGTAELIRAALIRRLLLGHIKIVNGTGIKPDFSLNVLVHVYGIDVRVSAFPHYYLALYLNHTRSAHVIMTLNAYSLEDYLPQLDLRLEDKSELEQTNLFWILNW